MKNINQDIVVSLILIVLSLFFLINSFSFPNNVGTFPQIISVIVLVMASITLINGIMTSYAKYKSKEENDNSIKFSHYKQPIIACIYFTVYIISIKVIGFFISTFLFLIFFMKFFRIKSIKNILIVSIGVNVFIYILFINLLKIKLPVGILF